MYRKHEIERSKPLALQSSHFIHPLLCLPLPWWHGTAGERPACGSLCLQVSPCRALPYTCHYVQIHALCILINILFYSIIRVDNESAKQNWFIGRPQCNMSFISTMSPLRIPPGQGFFWPLQNSYHSSVINNVLWHVCESNMSKALLNSRPRLASSYVFHVGKERKSVFPVENTIFQ